MRSDAKTVFLTVNFASNVRDILRGNILKVLKASGHRIVILSPTYDDPQFRAEFESDNVIVEPLYEHQPGRLERKLNSMRFTLFPDLCDTIQILTRPIVHRSYTKKVLARTAAAIVRLIGQSNTRKLLRTIITYGFPDKYHAELFRRYRPSLVCLTEFFHLAPDQWVLKRAVREGISTIGLVHSWDNLTTKGAFPAKIDKLVVWSETMRREAATLHGYDPNDVFVGGVPQFDAYTDVARLPSREEFLRRTGADPDKKLITYAMVPKGRFPEEMQLVEELWKRIQANAFARPCQLLVRLYPLRGVEVPSHLKDRPSLIFDLPGTTSRFLDRNISLVDLHHLGATMRYSDVVLNMASTISVDAAACGTPVVCVAFDIDKRKPYHESVLRYYDMTHYRRTVETGGVRVASSIDQLIEHVNAYLMDRRLDEDGRQRLVENECYRLDGRSGERTGNFILQRLDEVTRGVRRSSAVADGRLAEGGA